MAEVIDARGLSCPQPVLLVYKKIKKISKGVFEVLVDTDTSKENVSRLASEKGWQIEVNRMDEDYRLVLKKE
jgi:TusA-related sulfurtransferase